MMGESVDDIIARLGARLVSLTVDWHHVVVVVDVKRGHVALDRSVREGEHDRALVLREALLLAERMAELG